MALVKSYYSRMFLGASVCDLELDFGRSSSRTGFWGVFRVIVCILYCFDFVFFL